MFQKNSNSDFNYVKCVLESKGFTLGKQLNSGSFAVVVTVTKKGSDEAMAVKLIDKSKAPDSFVEKFLPKELMIMKVMKHKNVVKLFEICEVGWMTCIFMELATGGDLLGYVCEKGFVDDDDAKVVFRDTVEGVRYIHSLHVGHRDLKCENILLDENRRAKIADFGFARYVVDSETKKRQLSETYCGSGAYAAPEVLKGTAYNPMISDVWGLGVILFVMVCGVMPFDDIDHVKMVRNQMEKNFNFNPDRKALIPPQCRRLVRKIMEPDVCERITIKQILASDWLENGTGSRSTPGLFSRPQI